MTLEELALSNMWEPSALVELLGRKGILTRIDVLAMIQELRREHPQATKYNHPPQKQSAITFWIIWGSPLLTRLVCRSKCIRVFWNVFANHTMSVFIVNHILERRAALTRIESHSWRRTASTRSICFSE